MLMHVSTKAPRGPRPLIVYNYIILHKHGTQSVCVLCNMDDMLLGSHSSYSSDN